MGGGVKLSQKQARQAYIFDFFPIQIKSAFTKKNPVNYLTLIMRETAQKCYICGVWDKRSIYVIRIDIKAFFQR